MQGQIDYSPHSYINDQKIRKITIFRLHSKMYWFEKNNRPPMSRTKIVFSADDFGKNKKSNDNIAKLVRLNKIDRVAVMVDRKISDNETHELLDSKVKLDIHLELPKSKREDEFSILKRSFMFALNFFSRANNITKVKKDWERQIKKFEEIFGQLPDGLNSHEYVHFFPPYFKIALELSDKFNIPHVRFSREKVLYEKGNIIPLILSFLQKINKRKYLTYLTKKQKKESNSSDYMISLGWMKNPSKFTESLPEGETEIVCHLENDNEMEWIMNN